MALSDVLTRSEGDRISSWLSGRGERAIRGCFASGGGGERSRIEE